MYIVIASNRQTGVDLSLRSLHAKPPLLIGPLTIHQMNICFFRFPKTEHLLVVGQLPPNIGVGILGREHSNTIKWQCGNHCTVFSSNRLNSVEELLVFTLCVIDQRHRRQSQAGEFSNFSYMVHSQLDHSAAMVSLQS